MDRKSSPARFGVAKSSIQSLIFAVAGRYQPNQNNRLDAGAGRLYDGFQLIDRLARNVAGRLVDRVLWLSAVSGAKAIQRLRGTLKSRVSVGI